MKSACCHEGKTTWNQNGICFAVAKYSKNIILRVTIANRTYDIHKNVCSSQCSLTVVGTLLTTMVPRNRSWHASRPTAAALHLDRDNRTRNHSVGGRRKYTPTVGVADRETINKRKVHSRDTSEE